MNRRPFVAGNWKMNLQASTALQLTQEVVRTTGRHRAVDVGIIPSHPFLAAAGHKLEGTRLQLGAQDGPTSRLSKAYGKHSNVVLDAS